MNAVIEAAVDVALAARSPGEIVTARALLDAVTADIPESEWPDRCPEVLGAFEQLDSMDEAVSMDEAD